MSKLFTQEQEKFLKKNAKGIFTKELTEKLNKKFLTNFKESQVRSYKKNHKISSGLKGRFEKGHIPANKGKRLSKELYEKVKPTMFKKGNIPSNYRPVGSERVNSYGYVEIKVKDPNKWNPKHRILWEEENGSVPEGHVLIFADGNRQNLSLDNIVCVSRNELARLNQKGLISENSNLTKVGINIVKLNNAIRNIRKAKKKEKAEEGNDKR